MKIREDFVTNSSSSSFCRLSIKCKPLAEMFENYDRTVRERGQGEFLNSTGLHADSARGEVWGNWDEYNIFDEVPDSLESVLSVLCRGIVNELREGVGVLGGDGVRELVGLPVAPLVRAIAEHRDEIEKSVEKVYWTISDTGWGGDDELRFDQDMYGEEGLAEIKQSIASSKGCSVDKVSDEDFFDYVAGATSIDDTTFEYDRAKGIEELTRDFGLL